MKNILKGLSKSKLEHLRCEWTATGENPELLKFVEDIKSNMK